MLENQRRLTRVYIEQDPSTIALIPTIYTDSASGGQVETDGDPREPQTFKLIALAYNQRPTVTVNGQERIIDYHLLGEWHSIMEVGDHWFDEADNRYEIISFDAGHGYEKKAFVEKRNYVE